MIRYLLSLSLAAALTVAPVRAAVILINPYAFTSYAGQDVFEIVTALGETTDLQFCLDAGDATSYTSGQRWNDLSGNTQHFFLGTGGTVQASDPTFNGVAGALSSAEYFSFDGSDLFWYEAANETWMTNAHKDNAVFTFMFWFYADTLGADQVLAGTMGAFQTGFRIRVSSTGRISLQVANATATVLDVISTAGTHIVTENAWNFVAVSLDESVGAGGTLFVINELTDTDTATYTSPSTGNATGALNIGAGGDSDSPLLATGRLAMACGWSRALSASSLSSLYNATNDRGF